MSCGFRLINSFSEELTFYILWRTPPEKAFYVVCTLISIRSKSKNDMLMKQTAALLYIRYWSKLCIIHIHCFPHFTDEREPLSSYALAKDPGSPTGAGGHCGNVSGMRTHLDSPWNGKNQVLELRGPLYFSFQEFECFARGSCNYSTEEPVSNPLLLLVQCHFHPTHRSLRGREKNRS